jgi:type II secretory ATPase GspE/PulE/Tfp pilus assembly ATPase PilB-like protein
MECDLTVVPALRGEQIAIEIRPELQLGRRLDELGLEPGDLARLRGLLAVRSGLLVVTGEPGHGRSTIYAALLSALAEAEHRIVSVQRGVANPHADVIYVRMPEGTAHPAEAWIAAALRLGPSAVGLEDIPGEAAGVQAVRAALGGVFCIYTLSQPDATSAARFLEGLPLVRGSVSAALLGVLAVRLVRRTCIDCAVESPLPIELTGAVRLLGGSADGAYVEGTGCAACAHSGSSGVQPLFELVSLDDAARRELVESRNPGALATYVGSTQLESIRGQAVRLAAEGAIPVAELARIV